MAALVISWLLGMQYRGSILNFYLLQFKIAVPSISSNVFKKVLYFVIKLSHHKYPIYVLVIKKLLYTNCFGLYFPTNKRIWTPKSMVCLLLFHYTVSIIHLTLTAPLLSLVSLIFVLIFFSKYWQGIWNIICQHI